MMKLPWHKNGAKAELFVDLMVIGGVWNVAAYWMDRHNEFDSTYIANEIVESLSMYKKYV